MGCFSNHTVTLAGRRALARSWADDVPLRVLRIEIGDGVAPEGVEALEGLVSCRAVVPISSKRDLGGGVVAIRGVFKANEIMEGFYFREVGVVVEGDGGEAVLFCYANSGDLADFLAPTEASSLTDEVITLSLLTGSADVLVQDIDPNAAMTVRDVEEMFEGLDMEGVREDIKQAGEDIERLKGEIEESAAGFVKKAGDVMSGRLVSEKGFTGDLDGSALLWNGWRVFDGLEVLERYGSDVSGVAVSLPSGSVSLKGVVDVMPVLSRLVAFIGVSNGNMPGIGVLDVQRVSGVLAVACFTGVDGRSWRGAVYRGAWSGWGGCNEVPVATILPFDGSAVPVGYVLLDGRLLDPLVYPLLFAAIGYRYGRSGDFFRVQDGRGLFLRGCDNGRGIDQGRVLGSFQDDAIRNITGAFDTNSDDGDHGKWGAFYRTNSQFGGANGTGASGWLCGFDASRVVPTANENRPKNIAVNYIQKY